MRDRQRGCGHQYPDDEFVQQRDGNRGQRQRPMELELSWQQWWDQCDLFSATDTGCFCQRHDNPYGVSNCG